MSRPKEPVIPADLVDRLLAGSDPATALDQGGLLDLLKKALAEFGQPEMDHLGDDEQGGNIRKGYGRKTVVPPAVLRSTSPAIFRRPAADRQASAPVEMPPRE